MTPTKAKDGKSNLIDGESAIEDALAATGASKLQREITDANVDSLRTRAEQMLWIGADRRARWKDVEDRAISNVRWPWLPPKGLDDLRRRAISTGDWRDNNDGYIEKGPFPPPKTSVKAVTKNRDDIPARRRSNSPPSTPVRRPQIHYASTPDVSARLPDRPGRRLRVRRDRPLVPRRRPRRQARRPATPRSGPTR